MYDGFFSVFGLPCQLHSDQGKNFESKLFREMCELTGIAKTRSTSFIHNAMGKQSEWIVLFIKCFAAQPMITQQAGHNAY